MTTASLLASTDTELSSYAYSYPHKSSYRALSPPVRIAAVWRDEDASLLSLYVHLPFCEMRCGFCNLFTQSQPTGGTVDDYLATLHRQMNVIRREIPQARFQQFAIGGGTPTLLSVHQLSALLRGIEESFDVPISQLPTSIETSPTTATSDRLQVLHDFGVQRISLGVQSFLTTDSQLFGRPQKAAEVFAALDRIRDASLPILNIDLIYGDPQQSLDSWLASVREALRYRPEELYLYPLYVRPDTGLAKVGRSATTHRSDLYRAARDLLRETGYQQTSLRGFRWPGVVTPSTYTCQRDGMIGMGCGARSYTQSLHYGTRFATTQTGIKAILGEWVSQTDEELALATHGFPLDADEQLRRYVIMSLLQVEGLSITEVRQRFPDASIELLPEWSLLEERGWLQRKAERYVLTESGIENSDRVGPILYSPHVREQLRLFVERTASFEGG